ncbi:hypothetical protein BDZ88DRAFT_403829 [Geranomyces variabilis]|nr:hypothetical protein BDZ88DRAFT_403829 [Geranomyces variabilis]KAJ3141552.1 hypothetical protein HDU90_005894 [Geranomyces variabilis]
MKGLREHHLLSSTAAGSGNVSGALLMRGSLSGAATTLPLSAPTSLKRPHSDNSGSNIRQKRAQVKNACVNCQRACKKCDEFRPCTRCTKFNLGDSCRDSERKERTKGFKRGTYKRTSSTSSGAGGASDGYDSLPTDIFGDHNDAFRQPHREKPSKTMTNSALVKSAVPESVFGTAPQLAMAAEFEHRSSAVHPRQRDQIFKHQEAGQHSAFPAYHHLYIATPASFEQCPSRRSKNHHHHYPTSASLDAHDHQRRPYLEHYGRRELPAIRDDERTPPVEAVQTNELPPFSSEGSSQSLEAPADRAEQTDWTKLDVLSNLCSAVLHDNCENNSEEGERNVQPDTPVAPAESEVQAGSSETEKREAGPSTPTDDNAEESAGSGAETHTAGSSTKAAKEPPHLVPFKIPVMSSPRGHRAGASGPSFASLFGPHPTLHSDQCSHNAGAQQSANYLATSPAAVPLLPTVYPELTHLHMHPAHPHLPLSFIDYRHHRGPAAAPPALYPHHVPHLQTSAFRRHWDYACEEGYEEATALMNRYTEVGDLDVDDPPENGRCAWIEF